MRELLVILNPRRIEECLDAFRALPIDKLWIRNMSEFEIQERWPEILEAASDYDRLYLSSDDGIPRPHALKAVRHLAAEGHPVVTGYSNLSSTDYRVNLTKAPVDVPKEEAYDLYALKEVMEWPQPSLPSFFAGMCLTGMSHSLWQRHPFRVYWNEPPGSCSDFMLSRSLNEAKVPIVAAREAFVWHTKETWNQADKEVRKRLYIGREPAEIVLDTGRVPKGLCLCR